MNWMLQPHELIDEEMRRHQEEIRRHQRAAQQAADAGMLGRLAANTREMSQEHPLRTRALAIVSPMAVALGVLAVLS